MSKTPREDIPTLLEMSFSDDPAVRREALGHLCPCHVKSNQPELWNRLVEMVLDPDVKVRRAVVHTLCDGSPRERAPEVVHALERMYNDPDEKLRKGVRRIVQHYRRTGKVNIL
ncbi:MAG TPA: HEAT repeat domain-containing protein [Planctomycetota bacterium]|nr:HEAT repeat domain-containing protein [Planctomycetota bacterium]